MRQDDHTGDNKGNSSKNQGEGTTYGREKMREVKYTQKASEQESQRCPGIILEGVHGIFFSLL